MRSRRLTLPAVAIAAAAAATVAYPRRPAAPPTAEQGLSRVLAEVRFDQTPLHQALESLARQSGAPIALDRSAIKAADLDPTKPVDLRLRNVTLTVVLTQ